MIAVLVHKENGVEDLHGQVRIHRGGDVGDLSQVAIDKLTQADIILHGATSAAPAHIQLKVGDAERVLHVDQHQPGFGRIRGGRLQRVLACPVPRLAGALLVGNPPDGADSIRVKKRWEG